jgi:hypothetical protein
VSIKYRKGYKYQLAEAYQCEVVLMPDNNISTPFICLSDSGLLTIHAGYAWDGPSGPTFDTKTFMRGSLIHDALYQLMRGGSLSSVLYKAAADRELFRACIEDGMWKWRARMVLKGLQICGRAATLPKNRKTVLEAPAGL